MSEATEAIRQDIATIRESMTDKLEQIESKVRGTVDTTAETVSRMFDLKQQVGDHPFTSVGLASLAGYLLGALGGSAPAAPAAPRPGEPMRYSSDRPAAQGGQPSGQGLGLSGEIAHEFGDELQVIASAALAAALGMLRDTLGESLTQFHQAHASAPSDARPDTL
jgi:ElaB/YqjD/DUF883 family membrane-anchored ribosome-binding protein